MIKIVRTIACGYLLSLVVGCGIAPINDNAKSVQLMKNDPPQGCNEIGTASASAYGPSFQNSMRNKLKNKAADMGGNYVRLETVNAYGNDLTGTVFSCPGR